MRYDKEKGGVVMAFEEFYQSLYPTLFYQWISLNQARYKKDRIQFEIGYQSHIAKKLFFQMDFVVGTITIYNNNIVEQCIQDHQGHQIFYLHFEIKDLSQACQMFKNFYDTLLQHNNYRPRHIALCCTGGLSTSVFADEIQEVCQLDAFPLYIDSLSLDELSQSYEHYDAIYLAPQVADLQAELMTRYHKPVYRLNVTDFATKNYRAIVQTMKEDIEKDK